MSLHTAARRGDLHALNTFISTPGVNLNARDDYGNTPLNLTSDYPTAVALLAAGADASVPDIDGFSPLHGAVVRGDVALVERLLEAGAAVDAFDHDDDTPLHLCWDAGIAERLVGSGADEDAHNRYGLSPAASTTYASMVLWWGLRRREQSRAATFVRQGWAPGVVATVIVAGTVDLGGLPRDEDVASWVSLVTLTQRWRARITSWLLGRRQFVGQPPVWSQVSDGGIAGALRDIKNLAECIVEDRLHLLRVLTTAWGRHGGVAPEMSTLHGDRRCNVLYRTLTLRRVCRVRGDGCVEVVEPLGHCVTAFL